MKKVSACHGDDIGDIDTDEIKIPNPIVTRLLFNATFIDSVKNFLSMLDPIAKLINVCQTGNATVADAYEE